MSLTGTIPASQKRLYHSLQWVLYPYFHAVREFNQLCQQGRSGPTSKRQVCGLRSGNSTRSGRLLTQCLRFQLLVLSKVLYQKIQISIDTVVYFRYCGFAMPRNKRTATRLTTTQVANILGISTKTLYRMLFDGRIPEPQRHPQSNYRIWDPVAVQIIRDNLEVTKK